MTRWVTWGVLAAGGIAIAIAWGFGALVVYVFLAGFTGVVTYAAGLGGEWLQEASRRRFEDRHR
jgi:hypothetical protein